MIRLLILVAALAQGCASPPPASGNLIAPDIQGLHPIPSEVKSAPGDSSKSCRQTLPLARNVADGETISAFELFNEYPPTRTSSSPGDSSLDSVAIHQPAIFKCLPDNALHFTPLIDGTLVDGGPDHIQPLALWRLPNGHYLATFIYKDYDMEDGEGESIEISGVLLNPDGAPITTIQELSSWYEYEGAIRVRDLHLRKGELHTTEALFSPAERDGAGRVIRHVRDGPSKIIRKHYSGAGPLPAQ